MSIAKTPSFSRYLTALCLGLTVPLLLFTAILMVRFAQAERTRLQDVARSANAKMAAGLERELAAHVATLIALATSPALNSGDLESFHGQAMKLARSGTQGMNIVLRARDGQQLVNTRLPFGTALPRNVQFEPDLKAEETRKPYVSDLLTGAVTRRPLFLIEVPVIRDGEVAYFLDANFTPEFLLELIRAQDLSDPFIVSIADRNGTVIARSVKHAEFVGKRLPGFDAAAGAEGTWSGVNLEAVSVVAAYRRSPLTGWLTAVAVPEAALSAPLRHSIALLGGLGAVLLASAVAFASFIARTMARAVGGLVEMTRDLASGKEIAPRPLPIREAETIGAALASASQMQREHEHALARANQELELHVRERTRELAEKTVLLEATLNNMDQGLLMVDAETRVQVCNARALELLDLPVELMSERPRFDEVTRHQFQSGEFENSGSSFRNWVSNGGFERVHHTYERERPNGRVLEIRTVPIDNGGAVRTYTDITARKAAERRVEHLARHDVLTDLPNRALFREQLHQALAHLRRRGGYLALLCLDLDQFKAVNDTHGHPMGDALLRAVSDRLRAVLRTEDVVSRFGGDEFAILQLDADKQEDTSLLADRLIQALAEPFLLDGVRVEIGASVGIAVAPSDGVAVDGLLKKADVALYRAKAEGRGTHRFYDNLMDVAVQARRELERELREAIATGQLELHFQPVLDLSQDRIVACEALVRWNHPRRGMLPPSEFISVAEETHLIVPLGAWVLRQACAEAARWPRDIRVAVNVSAVQLQQDAFAPMVVSALAAAGLPASRLEVEITETAVVHDDETILHAFQHLRALGVRLAMDDFGVGYSSLGYLRRFRFDRIKLDRTFVQDMGNPDCAAIIGAMVSLGAQLDIGITAEGVETQEQLDQVRREACGEAQGYFIGRPVPATQIRSVLSARKIAAA